MQHQMTNGTLYKNALAQQQPGYTALKLENEFSLLRALDEAFADVEGQDHACQAIKEQLFGILDKKSKNGPAATFLFAGPPAVGKTMLAQKIGEALGRPFERFDMSSYSDKEASIYLFGLNKSYKSSQPGRLTTFIKNHPVSVILLDEIEKAHTTVLDNVLQMLDRGTAYDLFYERSFPVNDCIFIFTSNVGASIYDAGDQFNLSAIPTSTVIKALGEEKNPSTGEAYFSRELVSRFASGKLIVFNKLRPEVLHRIAVGQMKKMCDDFYHQYRIESKIDCDVLADLLLFSLGGNADVRSLVGAVREFFLSSIERTMEMIGRNGYDGRVSSIRYRIDRSQMSAEAAEVLEGREMVCVLTFGGHIGGLPKALKERVSLVSADSGFSIADARKLDPAIAVIGVTKQNAAKARVLFDDLVGLGTPCYVYTKEADLPLLYYAESGAVDCFTPRRPLSFNEWIMGAVSGIDLSRAAGRLFRTNKVISSYKYSERTCTAEVTLSDFAVQIAYGGGESSLFAGKAAVPDVTFNDIIGAEEAKNELIPVIRQLKNYRAYRRNGIRIPRGILLDGPPGSGKTSIAKAVANAAGLPFIARNATEFLSRLVGEGEQRIRDLFAAARRYAPAIIFIDEIDCISKDRMGIAAEGYHSEGLTNALLSELDGFDTQNAAPVFVIAATNFDTHSSDSKLDKAFLRRFDKKIHVGLPKLKDRECFLKRELSKYEFSSVSDEKVGSIARRAAGWSLADLNLVVQNAVRHSETGDGFALTDGVLEEAFSSFRAGSRKAYDERDVRKTAYHEAGHAVTAVLLGLKPAYATIVARGDFGGFMQYSDEEKFDLTREECLNRICVSMAGRAADVCFYGNDGISTGASGDLRSATDLAMRMVCVYGMEEDFLFRVDQGMEDPAAAARVREIVTAQYQRALQLIRSNRDKVEAVAGALFERESLTGEELAQLILYKGESNMHSATARLLLKKLNSGINTFQASELERDADDSSLIPRKEIMALLYDGIIREEGAAYRILIDIAALREEVLRQEQGKHEAKEKERSVCTIDDIIHSEWRLKEDGGETEKTSAHEGEDLEQKEGDLFDIKEAIEQKYQEFLRRRRASLEQMSQDDDDDFEGDDEPSEEDDELFDEESRAYQEMLERADDDEFGEADEEDDEEIEVEFEDEDDEDEERRSREYRAKRSRELFEALRKLNDSTDGPDEQSPSLAQEYTSKDVDDFLEKLKAEEARRGREEWEEHRRLLEGLTHGGREDAEQVPEVSEGKPETAGDGPSDELKDYERQRDLLEMAIGLIESEELQDKLRAELLKSCAKKGSISISSYLSVRPNAEPQLVKRQLSALYEGGLLKRLPEPDIYEPVLPKEVFEACFELVACAKKAWKMASKPLHGSRASLEGVEQRENRPSCLDIIRRANILFSDLLRAGKIKTRKKLMKMVDGAVFACRNLGNLLEAAAYREIWLELDEMSDGSFKAMVKHYRRAD